MAQRIIGSLLLVILAGLTFIGFGWLARVDDVPVYIRGLSAFVAIGYPMVCLSTVRFVWGRS